MRAAQIPAGFTFGGQVARTAGVAVLILAGALVLARGAPAWAWLLLPVFWAFANFFEWTVHRFPMHRPLQPRLMYRNHAQLHHTAFTESTMEIKDTREMSLVMMPWYTIAMLFVAASPVAVLVGLTLGRPAAGVFYVGAITYFLFYETLHALYHLPDPTLARLGLRQDGLFAALRAHHARHHTLRRMAHVNFNVTVPLADWLLGTRERTPPKAEVSAGGRDRPPL